LSNHENSVSDETTGEAEWAARTALKAVATNIQSRKLSHLFRFSRLKGALISQNDSKINFMHYFNFLPKNVSDESGKIIKKVSRMVKWHQGMHSPRVF
jgi:hypothetical protein